MRWIWAAIGVGGCDSSCARALGAWCDGECPGLAEALTEGAAADGVVDPWAPRLWRCGEEHVVLQEFYVGSLAGALEYYDASTEGLVAVQTWTDAAFFCGLEHAYGTSYGPVPECELDCVVEVLDPDCTTETCAEQACATEP